MRRFLRPRLLGRCAMRGGFLGVSSLAPAGPPHDVLFTNLGWKDFAVYLPADRIHTEVASNEVPAFALTEHMHALALLPVVRTLADGSGRKSAWAPFLVDTGASATYFNHKTAERLQLGTPGSIIRVMGQQVTLHNSSHHFEDLNLLGTDVLKSTDLLIQYPSRTVSITRSQAPVVGSSFWVTMNGKNVFKVTPVENEVFALKEAVKAKLESQTRDNIVDVLAMQVKKHDGTVCDVMDAPLEANTAKTAYIIALCDPAKSS
jgi:hypothetical protein